MVPIALILWRIIRGVDRRANFFLDEEFRMIVKLCTGLPLIGMTPSSSRHVSLSVSLFPRVLLSDKIGVASSTSSPILLKNRAWFVALIIVDLLKGLILRVIFILVSVLVPASVLSGGSKVRICYWAFAALRLLPHRLAALYLGITIRIYSTCFSCSLHPPGPLYDSVRSLLSGRLVIHLIALLDVFA